MSLKRFDVGLAAVMYPRVTLIVAVQILYTNMGRTPVYRRYFGLATMID